MAVAFKEWAAVCEAIRSGAQTVLLRKGGISERRGAFLPEHARFLLYPTFEHQQEADLRPEWRRALPSPAPDGATVELALLADVVSVIRFDERARLEPLRELHVYAEEAIDRKFRYRAPFLYALLCRFRALGPPATIAVTSAYRGCRTWVELAMPVAIERAEAILADDAFAAAAARFASAA
ncbi:MAG: DUF1802 family protein [Acidobacteriota bacterium]